GHRERRWYGERRHLSCTSLGAWEPAERIGAKSARAGEHPDADLVSARCSGGLELPATRLTLAGRRLSLWDSLGGARVNQQGRVELRPQHGPELRRRGRLDAVHAKHLGTLGRRRQRRRRRGSLES